MLKNTLKSLYRAPEKKYWTGRIDHSSKREHLRWHQRIRLCPLDDLLAFKDSHKAQRMYVLMGFACDLGVLRNQGNTGALDGPGALRQALAGKPAHFADPTLVVDAGDIVVAGESKNKSEDALLAGQSALSDSIKTIMQRSNSVPIVMGGGHELAYGHGRGLYQALNLRKKRVGIINFDAHWDLREMQGGRGNSGTPFLQIHQLCRKLDAPFRYLCVGVQRSSNTIALYDTAERVGARHISREDIALDLKASLSTLTSFMEELNAIYLTVCLDVFDQSLAPGVSARNPYGLDKKEFFTLFTHIVQSGKVASFDIAELAPNRDTNNTTAQLAAKILFTFVDQK